MAGKNGHSKLTAAERRRAVDAAERHKYDRTHKKDGTRKGGARKHHVAGSRLGYDALPKKKRK